MLSEMGSLRPTWSTEIHRDQLEPHLLTGDQLQVRQIVVQGAV